MNFLGSLWGRVVITLTSFAALLWLIVYVSENNSTSLLYLVGMSCVFAGWHTLTMIQPAMFVYMPIIGWIIYFAVKFLLSYFIGIVALPWQIGKLVSQACAARRMS